MAHTSISSRVTTSLQFIEQDAAYIALPGSDDHSPSCVEQAISRGATTIVLERDDELCRNLSVENMAIGVRYIFVPCAHEALAQYHQHEHAEKPVTAHI